MTGPAPLEATSADGLDAGVVEDLRRSFEAALSHPEPVDARAELLNAGWIEALDADAVASVAVVFSAQGRLCQDVGALDDVMAHAVSRRWLDATGDCGIAYPVTVGADSRHLVFGAHCRPARLLWVDPDPLLLHLVDLEAEIEGEAVQGVDPDLLLISVSGPPSGRSETLAGDDAKATWGEAVAAGRVAVAQQMTAAAREVLRQTLSYARSRQQFGTPIATFQAVKHRLADTLVAVSLAEAAVLAAATTGDETAAAVAKVLAGRAAATAGRNCLQVFGGVGFTLEHDFHRYFRRNLVLELLFGGQRATERELGARLRSGLAGSHRFFGLEDLPPDALLAGG